MLERILLALLVKVGPWLLTKAMEWGQKSKETVQTDEAIDKKLETFKTAYKESFDGEAVTSEQRKALKASIRDFIKSENGGL